MFELIICDRYNLWGAWNLSAFRLHGKKIKDRDKLPFFRRLVISYYFLSALGFLGRSVNTQCASPCVNNH